jgi:hypothetical protein
MRGETPLSTGERLSAPGETSRSHPRASFRAALGKRHELCPSDPTGIRATVACSFYAETRRILNSDPIPDFRVTLEGLEALSGDQEIRVRTQRDPEQRSEDSREGVLSDGRLDPSRLLVVGPLTRVRIPDQQLL